MATEKRAILFTDIVGYSKMMSNDEKLALRLLSEHDQIVKTEIINAKGRVIKNIGDAFFAEFDSASDAISASIEFQKKLKDRNLLKEKREHIKIRVGIHTGQMLRRDEDLFGHDVNVCARLESISPEGGIVASEAALEKVSDDIYTREIGYLKLKNINDPVQTFRVYLDKDEYESQSQGQLHEHYDNMGVPIVDIKTYQTEDIFSTAFLYPQDLTGKQDSVCYGLVEGLVSDFQKIDRVRTPVVADCTKLKGSDLELAKLAQILQVDTVIESSISSDEKGIVVGMRMFDTSSGEFSWSGEWRQSSSDLRLIRGEIIRDLLRHYNMEVPDQISKYLEREFTSNADAMSCFYEAMQHVNTAHDSSDFESARDLFLQALEHDEKFVEARAQLGVTYRKLGFNEDAERELDQSIRIAENEKYEQSQSYVYYLMGIMNQHWYKYKKAIKYFERSLKLQVVIEDKMGQAKTLNTLAGCYSNISEVDRAQELLERSVEIRKNLEEADSLAFPYSTMGNIALSRNNYSDAIRYFKKSLALFRKQGNEFFCCKLEVLLADCHIQLGDYDDALEYLGKARHAIEDFDDPMDMGWLYEYYGQINLHQGKHKEAIEDFKRANNIYLQYGDLIENSIKATYHTAFCLIEVGNLKEAKKELDNLEKLNKRIKESDKILFKDVLVGYYQSCIDKINSSQIHSLRDRLIEFDKNEDINPFYEFWILAKCYANLGNHKNAKKMQSESIKLIKRTSKANSNASDRDRYINNGLHTQIMKPLQSSQNTASQSTTCGECEQELKPAFKFCPGCGVKL